MNQKLGLALALAALLAGGVFFGWQGVIFALTGVVFWLLMQFSRLMRVMRMAKDAPIGHVDSAVMLNAKLKVGMRLLEVLPLARSLGRKTASEPETFVWTDPGEVSVEVVLEQGRVTHWTLQRPETGQD
ncbi:hypothetical protein PEC18_27610 [Paucibacter sp. O1-1]|uniref:hypothetical protein n=1 Tax=Paucibacter sp. M5-1 TaxID=3015998 RepID=UPI0021D4980E|nr:hypothetical protein [Paucibacter sp. M5-1]MCU7374507.1 hypothetical protein [Paucibacter sp. O1-1]MCZ7882285.1 hypothetical protein [Paucibacter sp. M5-1]MDA3829509.1 hypothetical protein [Paucibacter sp. O1-1]